MGTPPVTTCPGGEIRADQSGNVSVYCPADEQTTNAVVDTLEGSAPNAEVRVTAITGDDMEQALQKAGETAAGDEPPTVTITTGTEGDVTAAVLHSDAIQKAAAAGVSLEVQSLQGSLTISPEALKALAEAAGDSQLVIRYTDLTREVPAEKVSGGSLRQASPVVDVSVLLIGADGQVQEFSPFQVPISLTLHVDLESVSNPDLLGIYLLVEDEIGEVVDRVYVGGTVDAASGTITAERDHLSRYVALEYTYEFTDVPETHWAYETIQLMMARQIAFGVTPDQFQPDTPITRVDFAVMAVRALRLEQDATLAAHYSDAGNHPMAGYIGGALKAGLMNGYPDGTFRPDAQITRQEMAVVLTRMLKRYQMAGQASAEAIARTDAFQDRSAMGNWSLEAVQQVVDRGLMQGRPGPAFVPGGNTTRAEAVTVLKRIIDLINQR